ncbi:hypothetical protein CTA2_6443 [Colletotrichum tanaceti]|nr:hypothetical protein CTA2_6443 [Colletotrichum tanaceti]
MRASIVLSSLVAGSAHVAAVPFVPASNQPAVVPGGGHPVVLPFVQGGGQPGVLPGSNQPGVVPGSNQPGVVPGSNQPGVVPGGGQPGVKPFVQGGGYPGVKPMVTGGGQPGFVPGGGHPGVKPFVQGGGYPGVKPMVSGLWSIHADFTKCKDTPDFEAILKDNTGKQLADTKPTSGMADFAIPSPFSGTLVIKAVDKSGLGTRSHLLPQQLALNVFPKSSCGKGDPHANVTVMPGQGQPASIAQVLWNDAKDDAETAAVRNNIEGGMPAVLSTLLDGGVLKVFYVSDPMLSAAV